MVTGRSDLPTAIGFERTRPVIVPALVVGVVLGLGGNFVPTSGLQSLAWGLSALGLIVGCVLLAVELVSAGDRVAAGGFALLALGETRVLNPVTAADGEASFAAGVLLYAAGLVLVSMSGWAPMWVRGVGAAAAVAFAAHGLVFFGGGGVDSAGPLTAAGYALFSVTVIGWVLVVRRSPAHEPAPRPDPDRSAAAP
jgi:hypothetical protein